MQLAEEGFLAENGVKLLGANPETIHKAEDRQAFKDTMEAIGEPCIPSKVVETVEDALDFAEVIHYPVIVRPAFTLGGTGGGIAYCKDELHEIATNGLRLSPITQILVEKCISGWKEIEFEVIRDARATLSPSARWKLRPCRRSHRRQYRYRSCGYACRQGISDAENSGAEHHSGTEGRGRL